jgi:hypothetical protein
MRQRLYRRELVEITNKVAAEARQRFSPSTQSSSPATLTTVISELERQGMPTLNERLFQHGKERRQWAQFRDALLRDHPILRKPIDPKLFL